MVYIINNESTVRQFLALGVPLQPVEGVVALKIDDQPAVEVAIETVQKLVDDRVIVPPLTPGGPFLIVPPVEFEHALYGYVISVRQGGSEWRDSHGIFVSRTMAADAAQLLERNLIFAGDYCQIAVREIPLEGREYYLRTQTFLNNVSRTFLMRASAFLLLNIGFDLVRIVQGVVSAMTFRVDSQNGMYQASGFAEGSKEELVENVLLPLRAKALAKVEK